MRTSIKRSMTRTLRFLAAIGIAVLLAGNPRTLHAQNLGPFRQFLAFEGSYTRLQLDGGDGEDMIGLNGYSAHLWINLAPFLGPGRGVKDHTAIALFYSATPRDKGILTKQYGAELDIYPLHVPIANLIDPFLSLGAGRLRLDNRSTSAGGDSSSRPDINLGSRHYFAFTPGVGIRIPIPNRFQLRFDAADLIVFNRKNLAEESSVSHSPLFKAGIGLTF